MPTPADNLRTLLATTATWQTLVGATGNSAQKLAAGIAAIHLFGIKSVPDAPFIIIDPQSDTFEVIGAPNTYRDSGTLAFRMRLARPSADTWESEFNTIDTSIRAIAAEALALAATSGYLCISRITLDNHNRSSFVEDADYWEITGTVEWP